VLGQLAGQDLPDSGLDLARGDRRALVVVRQPDASAAMRSNTSLTNLKKFREIPEKLVLDKN